jgi:hypothetical protein
MLHRPLSSERRAKLMAVLSPENSPFKSGSREALRRIETVILMITSMPEYQLC